MAIPAGTRLPHLYSELLHVGLAVHGGKAHRSLLSPPESVFMQDPGYELPRITLLGNRVNKILKIPISSGSPAGFRRASRTHAGGIVCGRSSRSDRRRPRRW